MMKKRKDVNRSFRIDDHADIIRFRVIVTKGRDKEASQIPIAVRTAPQFPRYTLFHTGCVQDYSGNNILVFKFPYTRGRRILRVSSPLHICLQSNRIAQVQCIIVYIAILKIILHTRSISQQPMCNHIKTRRNCYCCHECAGYFFNLLLRLILRVSFSLSFRYRYYYAVQQKC